MEKYGSLETMKTIDRTRVMDFDRLALITINTRPKSTEIPALSRILSLHQYLEISLNFMSENCYKEELICPYQSYKTIYVMISPIKIYGLPITANSLQTT